MKNRTERFSQGFTLIELLVVIAVIGILAGVILASLNSARAKARDARRITDMRTIVTALSMYHNDYGCIPITLSSTCGPAQGTYSANDAGAWESSSQAGFLGFLETGGYISKVPVDPINNMTGDGAPAGTYAYRYYCYPGSGLALSYFNESGTWSNKFYVYLTGGFTCK